MRNYSTVILLLFCFSISSAQWDKNQWKNHKSIKNAQVSYSFKDLSTGNVIEENNSNKLLNPASTIKLLTSFIFLESVGEEHQFKTIVGYTGKLENDGTLKGDVIIRGTGDPSFASARYGSENSMEKLFSEIGAFAQKAGITCIDGNIIVDASSYGSDCTPHTWQWNDMGNYYAAGVWSMNVNENAYKLSFNRSTKDPTVSTIYPEIPLLYFTSELTRGSANSGDQAYIFCAPYQDHAYVRGSIPSGKGSFSIRGSIPNAPLFAGFRLQQELASRNISIQKVTVSYTPKKIEKTIWSHDGIPASSQVKSTIQKSINIYCEAFLKQMGNGDREKGISFMKDYLKRKSIIKDEKDIQIADGSGLSQRNYISSNTMVDFLRQYKKDNPSINKYLARNGYDGTLKNAFKKRLKGKIYGKSGSMEGVRAYAGFITTKKNKELAFSVIINNFTVSSSEIVVQIEKLLEGISESY